MKFAPYEGPAVVQGHGKLKFLIALESPRGGSQEISPNSSREIIVQSLAPQLEMYSKVSVAGVRCVYQASTLEQRIPSYMHTAYRIISLLATCELLRGESIFRISPILIFSWRASCALRARRKNKNPAALSPFGQLFGLVFGSVSSSRLRLSSENS